MTTEEFRISEMKETEYTFIHYVANGKVVTPKNCESTWITKFLINNPTKRLDDIFNLPKFKMEDAIPSKNYHLLNVILENGQKHRILFLNKKCIADEWTCLYNDC